MMGCHVLQRPTTNRCKNNNQEKKNTRITTIKKPNKFFGTGHCLLQRCGPSQGITLLGISSRSDGSGGGRLSGRQGFGGGSRRRQRDAGLECRRGAPTAARRRPLQAVAALDAVGS
ncbi:hypothetical protein JDV02_000244 [Purpureocillium takamizusanense]|uniref:Uncharacterized protein n=1 Tax=Purpureocillium takamizusanense TaxID=2060973 RepID=A0A9Q8V656_9HYPO|nr:uncharacterized protein JDV02_000244 [Purpureocillium takamizusanense]UNI13504.1 hypothetical protein JDV02_000244 [Purpureocillium takamizusanense]